MQYIRRIIDSEIDERMQAFNGINIIGPKGSGKTRTASERCRSAIEFQDEEKREGYLAVAQTAPHLLLKNEKPILFDEWQDAPKIWGAIRKDCDDHPEEKGSYFLTGSTSKRVETPHTGTGRISEIELYPMTLFETGESNGSISLSALFENGDYEWEGRNSSLSFEELFYAACRGGWPGALAISNRKAGLEIARDYYRQIWQKDVSAIDGVKRNPEWTRTILWSFARNMGTLAKRKTIYTDVKSYHMVSDATIASYISVLEQLFVIRDIDAWTPQIRSRTAIRASKKHIFVDPSVGIAALGIGPEYFNNDMDLFGHVFENIVLRDLLVFAEAHNARLMHYRDDSGLEADAVYQLADGRYALIEIKTGISAIPTAEKNLLRFDQLIDSHNQDVGKDKEHPGVAYRKPSQLIIICANAPMSFETENGVKVIPVGCLRD